MIIILYIIAAIILAVIFYTLGAINHTDPLPNCCLTCLHDHNHDFGRFSPYCCDHYGLRTLKSNMEAQSLMMWELRREFELNVRQRSNPIFYSATVEQQKVTDRIAKSAKSAEELSKDLYEIIKH